MTQLQRAAKTGDKTATLIALRESVWASIIDPKTGGRDIASLSKRWLEITNELEIKRRCDYENLRDVIVNGIEKSESGRDIASLSTRLIDVLNEIEALPDEKAKKNPAQRAREMVKNRKHDIAQGQPKTDVLNST